VDNLFQIAHAILTLAAAGAPVPEVLVDELAGGILKDAVVSLAGKVAEGGSHKLMRAVELAEAVMRMGEEERGSGGPLAHQVSEGH
jgi:hypothetical protein